MRFSELEVQVEPVMPYKLQLQEVGLLIVQFLISCIFGYWTAVC